MLIGANSWDEETSSNNLEKDGFQKLRIWHREIWRIFSTFQLISHQTPRFTIGDCAAGHRADNRDKNRNVLIVPRKFFWFCKLEYLQVNNSFKFSIVLQPKMQQIVSKNATSFIEQFIVLIMSSKIRLKNSWNRLIIVEPATVWQIFNMNMTGSGNYSNILKLFPILASFSNPKCGTSLQKMPQASLKDEGPNTGQYLNFLSDNNTLQYCRVNMKCLKPIFKPFKINRRGRPRW